MLKKVLMLLLILISITFLLSIIKIEKNETISIETTSLIKHTIPYITIQEKPIGKLIIPSISLIQDLYQQDSKENTIEKHVEILKSTNYPSHIYIAAHSGEGEIAYFNNIIYLEKGNIIELYYYDDYRIYEVEEISKVDKMGYIGIPKTNNSLILTTCDQNDLSKQIIVRCKEKES